MADGICSIEGCLRAVKTRGFCNPHYKRLLRHGDPLGGQAETAPGRFWQKVDKDGPLPEYRPELGSCWVWKPSAPRGAYGLALWEGRVQPSHRIAYMIEVGPIPEGLVLDHLCRVLHCVNPAHLEPVTSGENVHRGNQAKGRGGHGSRATYLRHGCRCDLCVAAQHTYSRAYKKRRRANAQVPRDGGPAGPQALAS